MKMQVAIELDDDERGAFRHWAESVAIAADPDHPQLPHLTPGQAIRALILAALNSEAVTAAVIDQLQIDAMP